MEREEVSERGRLIYVGTPESSSLKPGEYRAMGPEQRLEYLTKVDNRWHRLIPLPSAEVLLLIMVMAVYLYFMFLIGGIVILILVLGLVPFPVYFLISAGTDYPVIVWEKGFVPDGRPGRRTPLEPFIPFTKVDSFHLGQGKGSVFNMRPYPGTLVVRAGAGTHTHVLRDELPPLLSAFQEGLGEGYGRSFRPTADMAHLPEEVWDRMFQLAGEEARIMRGRRFFDQLFEERLRGLMFIFLLLLAGGLISFLTGGDLVAFLIVLPLSCVVLLGVLAVQQVHRERRFRVVLDRIALVHCLDPELVPHRHRERAGEVFGTYGFQTHFEARLGEMMPDRLRRVLEEQERTCKEKGRTLRTPLQG